MPDDLTKALLVEETAAPRAIAEALFSSVTGRMPLLQALVESGAVTPQVLARYLARTDEPQLERVVPVQDLVDRLPAGLCARLLAVPVRRDAITGTIDIAVADPADTHPAEEIAFHLQSPVRVVRASVPAIEEGLRRARMQSVAPPRRMSSELPPSRPEPFAPRRRNTPTWGNKPPSEAPTPSTSSDIPIPLTRRAFANNDSHRGGTQRPPAPFDPDEKLGKGYSVAPGFLEPAIEVRGRAASAVGALSPAIPAPPPTGGFAAFAPNPPADVGSVLASLRIATTRDEILDLVLTGARAVALKVALFVVKKGSFQGWSCTPELGDRAELQNVTVSMDTETVFDVAVKEGMYLGPLPNDDAHRRLVGFMRGASRDVAITPIRVSGKTAVVVVADSLGDTMIATRRLDEISRAAGEAFARIVRSKR